MGQAVSTTMDVVDVSPFWLAILLTPISGALRMYFENSFEASLIELEMQEAIASEASR